MYLYIPWAGGNSSIIAASISEMVMWYAITGMQMVARSLLATLRTGQVEIVDFYQDGRNCSQTIPSCSCGVCNYVWSLTCFYYGT